jgi:hypothetical protein
MIMKKLFYIDQVQRNVTVVKRYAVEAETFEEAIQLYDEEYNSLRADPEEWAKAVKTTELKIEREMLDAAREDGEATFNWLVSEFGDDIFPDRD